MLLDHVIQHITQIGLIVFRVYEVVEETFTVKVLTSAQATKVPRFRAESQ